MIPALSGLLALILLWPFAAEWSRRSMNAARQANAPGSFAELSQGRTHYRWSGETGDPVVVLVHGISTPSYVFAATERSLLALGFRVLSYDLYGRGYSDRAKGMQDIRFFLAQLRALLNDQNVTGPYTLLGFSMGGQIAAAEAARDENVERLILVAPSGLQPAVSDRWIWTAPVIGDWMTRIFGGIALRRQLVEHKNLATVIPDFEDRQAAETRMRGYLPALLSSRRHMLGRPSPEDHVRVAEVNLPVLAIWGTDDPVIPRRALGELSRLNPTAQHVEVKGAGHNLLQTHPTEIAQALKTFLSA